MPLGAVGSVRPGAPAKEPHLLLQRPDPKIINSCPVDLWPQKWVAFFQLFPALKSPSLFLGWLETVWYNRGRLGEPLWGRLANLKRRARPQVSSAFPLSFSRPGKVHTYLRASPSGSQKAGFATLGRGPAQTQVMPAPAGPCPSTCSRRAEETGDGPGRGESQASQGPPKKAAQHPKGRAAPGICCLPCKALKRSGAVQGGGGDAPCLPGLRKEGTGLLAGTHAPWVALSKSSSTQAVPPSVKWEE